jgi:hypothetical protein
MKIISFFHENNLGMVVYFGLAEGVFV